MAQYVFGLDIGIASVGWAVLGEQRIFDLGVRCFDKAETAKEGDPLNLTRREARLLRRRLYRRAWRLTQLARVLKREGLIDDARLFSRQSSFSAPDPNNRGKKQVVSAWELRRDGLDRLLSRLEWARVIYHLCKHRGFHWISKAEEAKADSDKEGGRVKQGLKDTAARMKDKGYRSAAEMVLAEFPDAQRNKRGQYDKALSRVLLGEELTLLFERQRALGNPHASERLQTLILGNGDRRSGLFWRQKPALAGADLLKMLGKCTFEKGEYRAPKASFSAERHVWLTRLNNLRVVIDGRSRPLNEAERAIALPLPYQTEAFKYKTLKAAFVKAGLRDEGVRFGGLSYPSRAQAEGEKAKDPEDQPLVKMPAWHELRKAFKSAGLESLWQRISTPALEGNPAHELKAAQFLPLFIAMTTQRVDERGVLAVAQCFGIQADIDVERADVRHLLVAEQQPGNGPTHDGELALEGTKNLAHLDQHGLNGRGCAVVVVCGGLRFACGHFGHWSFSLRKCSAASRPRSPASARSR